MLTNLTYPNSKHQLPKERVLWLVGNVIQSQLCKPSELNWMRKSCETWSYWKSWQRITSKCKGKFWKSLLLVRFEPIVIASKLLKRYKATCRINSREEKIESCYFCQGGFSKWWIGPNFDWLRGQSVKHQLWKPFRKWKNLNQLCKESKRKGLKIRWEVMCHLLWLMNYESQNATW